MWDTAIWPAAAVLAVVSAIFACTPSTPRSNKAGRRKLKRGHVYEEIDVGSNAGRVIGKGGRTINDIESSTGAKVVTSTRSSWLLWRVETCIITGSKSSVKEAARRVRTLADHTTERVSVGSHANAVIGAGGGAINGICRSSGARVTVSDSTCTIAGSRSQVQEAKRRVQAIVGSQTSERIPIGGMEGRLIGRNGGHIDPIQAQSGARLDVSGSYVTISGTRAQVQQATALLRAHGDPAVRGHIQSVTDVMGNTSRHSRGTLTSRSERLTRAGTRVLYHQTDEEAAQIIVRSQEMKTGSDGMVGGGIYFATCPEDTDRKALHRGPVLKCVVKLGTSKTIGREGDRSITFAGLLADGYDSVRLKRTGDELVVYNSDQVVKIGYHRR